MRKIIKRVSAKFTKRHVEAFRKTLRGFLFGVAEAVLFFLILWLYGLGLLDLRTIVSITVTEVGIGIFLYYLFGQGRRGSEEEMVNLMDATEKLSHLRVYTFEFLGAVFYYVENTTTKEYYKTPKNIEQMVELGVITTITCKDEEEMRAILQKNNSHPNEQEPTIVQLMATKGKRKTSGSGSP